MPIIHMLLFFRPLCLVSGCFKPMFKIFIVLDVITLRTTEASICCLFVYWLRWQQSSLRVWICMNDFEIKIEFLFNLIYLYSANCSLWFLFVANRSGTQCGYVVRAHLPCCSRRTCCIQLSQWHFSLTSSFTLRKHVDVWIFQMNF